MITLTTLLTNDCTLVGQTLGNVVTVTTTSDEVNLADNRDEGLLDCITASLVSLSGYVVQDRNTNCVREPGDSGIPGVTITLTGVDWCSFPVTLSRVTDQNGQYSFTGLEPWHLHAHGNAASQLGFDW